MDFKYRFVRDGSTAQFFAKKGLVTSNGLQLTDGFLPYESIVDTTTRDNRVAVVLHNGVQLDGKMGKYVDEDGDLLILEVSKVPALRLERAIDRHSSRIVAENNQKALVAEGKGHMFRSVTCPHCHSTIELTDFAPSRYSYCRFCESVLDGDKVATVGDKYRHCDECHSFDRVKGYTVFYFYFLLVVYGWQYNRRHLCDNCVGRLFWKVLFTNLIFILGVPSALWMKMRSLQGRDHRLADLAKANRHATAGKMRVAEPIYRRLDQQFPGHPGLLYNQGRGYLMAGEFESAKEKITGSLDSCSNYLPTMQLIQALETAADDG